MSFARVSVIGSGAWGTALAQAAALGGGEVTLVGRDPVVIDDINRNRCNSRYLPGLELSERVGASASLPASDLVILAVPAQQSRAVLGQFASGLAGLPVVLSAKGLERGTQLRQSEVLAAVVPGAIPFVLSGPSFAEDVAAGRPTAVTLAGDDAELTSEVAAALAGPTFRPYAADDRIGVELAGALKNVYALGAGAVDGAGLGASARSALIARAFAELTRLVVRMGGTPTSLAGLAGLGDLTLSCTSVQSRNYRYGAALGAGHPTDAIGLVEGVATAPVALELARRHQIDAPLIEAVNRLLSGTESIAEIVASLMARPLKRET